MKNYLSVATEWKKVKSQILEEHNRIVPLVKKLIDDFIEVSHQDIIPKYLDTDTKIKFYPFWGGFAYTYGLGWECSPNPEKNWNWTLEESKNVLKFLESLHEEEVKILFRDWSEKVYV
jgi:hypothetical protein